MSGPGERRRVVDLYSATPMAAARVAERLGYPTGQCLECRPAKDPGYAGHMAKSIIPCFASMFVRQVRQCFSAVWADGFPRCRHRFPVM